MEKAEYLNALFLSDLKTVRDVMIYAQSTNSFFRTTKLEARQEAKSQKIKYYIIDGVFKNKRKVIVII